jgi:ribosomal protein L16 Arg81 hydroxylase
VEDPDLNEFPLFADVPCEDFVAEEGDCLFIPKGYFHHVRALTGMIQGCVFHG